MKKLISLIAAFGAILLVAYYLYQANPESKRVTQTQNDTEVAQSEQTASTQLSETVENPTSSSGTTESTSQEPSTVVMTTKEANRQANNQDLPPFPPTEIKTETGKMMKLSSFKGKPTVINIWASWCPPCKAEMPYFQKAYDQYKDRVNFVMLNATGSQATETEEAADSFIADNGYTFPVYYDVNYQNQIAFSTRSLPTTLFFDEEGILITGFAGMVPEENLYKILEEIQ